MADETEYCRHCGSAKQPAQIGLTQGRDPIYSSANGDWLCSVCEHYQNSVSCPVCGQPVDIHVLPADMVPAAAKPQIKKGE